ncbi:MAG: TonB family protein [Myxococcales bacterium]|nr:TonB family protein [Myxococcales bacterium]
MNKNRRHRSLAITVCVIISLLVQVPIFRAFEEQATTTDFGLELDPDFTELELVPEPPKPKKVVKPKDEKTKGQYVTITPPKDPTPPKTSRFLARYNSSAKKEMKRKRSNSRKPKRTGNATLNVKAPKRTANKPQKTERKPKKSQTKLIAKAPVPPVDPNKVLLDETIKPNVTKKPEFRPRKKTGLLLPSTDLNSMVSNHLRMASQLPSDDYIKNVPEGVEDRLNAKYNKHWYFFERVKEKVRQQWKPAEVYRQRDPRGKIYGIKDRYTVLYVTLNQKGEIVRVKTLRESGVRFLDAEARRAFRAAGPFPNPSPGLANKDGLITFKFGFLFEISSSKFRTFWSRI